MEIPVRAKYQKHTVKKLPASGGQSGKNKRNKLNQSAKKSLPPQPKKVLLYNALTGHGVMITSL